MDEFNSLGLRIDDENCLRILSEKTQKASEELSSKIGIFLSDLDEISSRSSKIMNLIDTLDKQTNELRIREFAAIISKKSSG